MYSELLKKMMFEIYSITNRNFGIVDKKEVVVAYSSPKIVSFIESFVRNFNPSSNEGQIDIYSYKIIAPNSNCKFLILFEGKDVESLNYLKLVENLATKIYIERYNKIKKKEFLKKVLLDDIYVSTINETAEKYDINTSEKKVIILLDLKSSSSEKIFAYLEKNLSKKEHEIIAIDYDKIAIIKTIDDDFTEKKLLKYIEDLLDKIEKSLELKISASVGNIANNFKEISRSFKEATIALEVNKIFKNSNRLISYNSLGIARLIYKLPVSICEIFLHEILKEKKIENLDKETLFTIDKFFENSLNISETSRKLFIHRNTLVYRLEKIKNLTNLDLRIFEDATKFKLAIMVKKYLNFVSDEI